MSEIDWKTELRKIERAYDGLPPEPTAAERRAKHAVEQREQLRRKERTASLGALVRLGLVVALGAAIHFWPYDHSCGLGLIGFVAAEVLVVAGGLWVALITWRERMPTTHAIALLVALYGLALIELQVLPRIGYAKTTSAWQCRAA